MASTSATRKPVGDVRQFCATTKSYTSAGADTPAYPAQNRHAAMVSVQRPSMPGWKGVELNR